MLNSKLIDILKSYSHEEIKKFSEFLISPFHNKNKKAVKLFNYISKYHPGYENKNLTKEKLYELIFGEENPTGKYNDASVRNLLSDLMILSEKFLAYINFEKDKFHFNERILRELGFRKLSGVFEKRLKSAEDVFLKNEFSGEEDFYRKFVLEELKSSSSQYYDNLKLYKSDFIGNASDYLTYYFLIRSFKMMNFFEWQKQYNIDNSGSIVNELTDKIDTEKILNSVKDKSIDDYNILSVYFSMFNAQRFPDNDEFYFIYKKILTENESLFSDEEKYGLYICLTNCCIQKIDKGNDKFNKECFEVYSLMFEKNVFDAHPGYLSMTTFTAVLNTGLSSGEYERTEEFVNKYSDKLNPNHREDALNYSMAQIYFYKDDFGKALEYICRTDTEFSNFKFHLKILSLKIYYETEDYESLYYASDSFMHFIGKNKLVGLNYKKEFNNFLTMLDLLVKYRLGNEEKHFYKLKKMLESSPAAGRNWLKKKFEEIK
jgi:hypothetical protein